MWTHFWDMHSGGGQKLDWSNIYIEAPIEMAKVIFYNRFGRNPDRVTCTCCGPDYSISEDDTLAYIKEAVIDSPLPEKPDEEGAQKLLIEIITTELKAGGQL